jgi:hypothetical protein
MQIISTLRLPVSLCVYIWRYFHKHQRLCVSCHSAKQREEKQKFYPFSSEQEKANIKRANKTQHKSKLVKMKFSEFFSRSLCCWLLHRLFAAETATFNRRVFALIFYFFCTFSYVDNSIILLFASYMNSNGFF